MQILEDNVLFVVDSDSQIYGALKYADGFHSSGWKVLFCIPANHSIPHAAIERLSQKHALVETDPEALLISPLLINAAIVVVMLTGSKIYELRNKISNVTSLTGSRPITVTAFNGVVYENFEEGLAWRLGYDYILLNSKNDLQNAKAFVSHTKFEKQNFILTGLFQKDQSYSKIEPHKKSIIFSEQVNVPFDVDQRKWLFGKINNIAANSPDWTITIKPRVKIGEKTFFKKRLHPEQYFLTESMSPNLRVSYQSMDELRGTLAALLQQAQSA